MATILEPTLPREPQPESSERSFGYVFAVVFLIVACWPLLSWSAPRWWALGMAIAFVAVALVWPRGLRPLNRAWLALGHLMHRIVSPIIMGAVFFLVITPTGWIMRLRGKDLLSRKRRPELSSYWIEREAAAVQPESMRNQY